MGKLDYPSDDGRVQEMQEAARRIAAESGTLPTHGLPSPYQFRTWADWLHRDPELLYFHDGGWYFAYCPMHDKERRAYQDDNVGGAMINFDKGVLRCLADPACHSPQRVVSLVNIARHA